MSSANRTDAKLLDELESHGVTVRVEDPTASVPTLSCDAEDHNGEPIREGEHAVLLLSRTDDGKWVAEKTFCGYCNVLDAYSEMDTEGRATAVVEGVIVPENELGPSKRVYIPDAFLWELHDDE
jgi:hypothetical protein